jgi:hypothetical protein
MFCIYIKKKNDLSSIEAMTLVVRRYISSEQADSFSTKNTSQGKPSSFMLQNTNIRMIYAWS